MKIAYGYLALYKCIFIITDCTNSTNCTHLQSHSPTVLSNAGDGTNRLFYGEQNGIVWVWQKGDDGEWEELEEPFVDLSDFVVVG